MKTAAVLAALLLPMCLPALDIHVAPLLYVDETADDARGTKNAQDDLLRALRAVETGVELNFAGLKDSRINPPQSLADAVTVCRNEQIDYLLYGYITKRAYSMVAEIRLFDYAHRQVTRSFYAMDDTGHYGRLLSDMAGKILAHAGEAFNLGITPKRAEVTRITIPLGAGYWTPMASDWAETMLGTVTAGSGFAFVPTDNAFVAWGNSWYFSTGLDIRYRLGVGNPNRYQAYNHTLQITLPLRLHMALANRHEAFAGLGFIYFVEFFSITNKYADGEAFVYNNTGLDAAFGYRFRMNDRLWIFFRNEFDFLFNKQPLITYAPVIGVDIQVYAKEIQKKW